MDFDVSFSKELAEAEFVPNNLVNSIEKTNEMINMYKPQNNDYLIFDQNSPEPEKMSHDSNIFRKKPQTTKNNGADSINFSNIFNHLNESNIYCE
jgi:hypothetical protein